MDRRGQDRGRPEREATTLDLGGQLATLGPGGGLAGVSLAGSRDDVTMNPGDGNDSAFGDIGNDTPSGGGGADRFATARRDGTDRIEDCARRVDCIAIDRATRLARITFSDVEAGARPGKRGRRRADAHAGSTAFDGQRRASEGGGGGGTHPAGRAGRSRSAARSGDDPVDVAHLAARPGLGLAVEVD
jgi:hypothetical protein